MHSDRISHSNALLEQWRKAACASQFPLYTAFLENLVHGERQSAFHRYLRPLLADLAVRDHYARNLFIDALCRAEILLGYKAGTVPVPAMPYELLEQVATPTLLEQRRLQPDDPYVHVWLAILPIRGKAAVDLPDSLELLKQAHRLAPSDQFIAERLAHYGLDAIQFACHHLTSSLLGDSEDILAQIEELNRIVSLLGEEQQRFFRAMAVGYAKEVQAFVAEGKRGNAT